MVVTLTRRHSQLKSLDIDSVHLSREGSTAGVICGTPMRINADFKFNILLRRAPRLIIDLQK